MLCLRAYGLGESTGDWLREICKRISEKRHVRTTDVPSSVVTSTWVLSVRQTSLVAWSLRPGHVDRGQEKARCGKSLRPGYAPYDGVLREARVGKENDQRSLEGSLDRKRLQDIFEVRPPSQANCKP